MKATTFPNTFDILPPAAQMPTNTSSHIEAPNYSITPSPPTQYTDALGTPTLHITSSHPLFDGLQVGTHKPMHSEQDTTLPSPTQGPHKPLYNSQFFLLPLPQPGILSLRSKPHTGAPGHTIWESGEEGNGKGEGLQAGSPECLLCNKGSSRELESPWPPCCARKPGTSGGASRAQLSGRARAASPAASALPLAGAARVPMQMSRGGRGRERAPRRVPKRELTWGPDGVSPTALPRKGTRLHWGRLECQPRDSDAPRSCWQLSRRQKAPGFLRPPSGCGFRQRVLPKSFYPET